MKRSTFILTALAASAAVTIPIVHCASPKNLPKDPLAWPEVLGEFTDENTIREIGLHYREKFPSVNTKERLRKLLIMDQNGRQTAPTDDLALNVWIKDKIRRDFSAFNTITVDGWVISVTESRQCALFSLL